MGRQPASSASASSSSSTAGKTAKPRVSYILCAALLLLSLTGAFVNHVYYYFYGSPHGGPSLEAEVLLGTPSVPATETLNHSTYAGVGVGYLPSINDLLAHSSSRNLTELIVQYLQTLRSRAVLNPSFSLSSSTRDLHYGAAMRNLWELLKDMPLDQLTPQEQAEVWERIASPLVKLFLIDAEYIDRGLSLSSPIGSQAPVFIVGFPRSGLSYLQALIALDERSRSPLIWEAGFDVADYREKSYEERQLLAEELMHRMQVPPSFYADSLCDDSIIREYALTSNVVAYELYSGAEMIVWSRSREVVQRQMEFHRRWVQLYHELTVLSSPDSPPPQFWIFKGVDYVEKLPELLEVYPNARIVWVHNHLKEIIRKQLQESIALFGTGVLMPTLKYLQLMGQDITRSLLRLDELPANQLMHVQFAELKEDPIEMVRRIYEQLDLGPLTAQHEQAMQRWLASNTHESKVLQVSWSQALRLLGMPSEEALLDVYSEYLRRFPDNI